MAKIIVIDDELAMDMLCESLQHHGHEAFRIPSADLALEKIKDIISADLVVLDIIMSWPITKKVSGIAGNHTAGMEIFKEIRRLNKKLPILVYSATMDAAIADSIKTDPNADFLSKAWSPQIKDLVQLIFRKACLKNETKIIQSFIVHGHDETAKLSLKNYLQNVLHYPEPIILHEKPNLGRTLIEKFEETSLDSSIVFVLLTPDDIVVTEKENNDEKRRARQNVIFEMGYFLGVLGRRSGRVILLHCGPLELPSDLSGITYIDISNGIESAGEEIRREVDNVRT
jgi:predicted nucleotide-binding protein